MDERRDGRFISNVERLIDPMDVSHLLFLQSFRKMLPGAVFKKLLRRASRNTPHVGFVIEPYSLFLFFRLRDIEYAKSLLPDRYELVKSRVFADDEPEYLFGIGNLNTRASTFWGFRQESYLIARDTATGLPSWIFIDILSNTVIATPRKGITDPNARTAVFTTGPHGEVVLDFKEDKTERQLALTGKIENGRMRDLDVPLWLMGNTSIAHSHELSDGDDNPFAVIFDPAEVERALDIPTGDLTITRNTLFPGLAETELCKALCFPYAQHYIADSPGRRTIVRDRADMIVKYDELRDANDITTFSSRTIKKEIGIGAAVLTLIAAILVLVL